MDRTCDLPTLNVAADIVSSHSRTVAPAGPRPARPIDAAFSTEFALLRACCHSDPGLLESALCRDLQWERVFSLAAHHRILPALQARVQGRGDVPSSIQSALRARFLKHCQRVMRFSAELVAILKHFEARGVSVIAQKGPVLAHLLYGDAAMREFGDLDLLVPPGEVNRAVASLRELEYEKNLQLSPRQEKAYLRSGYEYVFGRGAERNLVELQWGLLPRFYAVDWDVEGLFARSQQHDFEGTRAQVLSREDQFLFLCVHAAKHQWAQLGMIRDIAALSQGELDWERVVAEGRRLGAMRIVAISLSLTRSLLGAGLPAGVLSQLGVPQRLAKGIQSNLFVGEEIHLESAGYFHFMMRLRERRRDWASFLWRLATTPSVGEWKAVRIPDALFPLYSGVRCFRLLGRMIG